jgi:acetyltransferase-like isoleucine patch superfamily enzyme
MPGVVIGRDCNIGDHCYIEGGVRLGDQVVVKNGVSVWEGVTLEDRVFVGPNVAFTNDRVPRAKTPKAEWDKTLVREGASLGANSTILPGITIGRYALIGAGAVVTKDVPDFALMLGNPARVRGHVCRCGERLGFHDGQAGCGCGRRYRMHDETVEEMA